MAAQNDNISGRFFLVGCARSGTTLLQAMLASHSRVFSFPESHFFCQTFPRSRRYRWLRLAEPQKAGTALAGLLQLLGRPDLGNLIPRHSRRFDAYSRAFVRAIDQATLDDGKDIWLEKTPHHVDYIPVISRRVPSVRFIHIVRDGRDVVASQYHAMLQDPGYWGNWSVERLVALWNQDIQTSLACWGKPGHVFVSYEALLDNPTAELQRVCAFMGVDFEPTMLEHWHAADRVVGFRRNDPWMRQAYEPLQDTRLKKYSTLFSREQQAFIADHLFSGGQVRRIIESISPQDSAPSPSMGRG